jgi:competence protein ComEC
MKRLPVIMATFFALGVAISGWIRADFFWCYAVLSALLLLGFLLRGNEPILFILVLSLGFVSAKYSRLLPQNDISRYFSYRQDNPYILGGFVESEPDLRGSRSVFTFRVSRIESGDVARACSGSVIVSLRGGRQVRYGDELFLRGKLIRPPNFKLFRHQGYRDYLYNRGIRLILNVNGSGDMLLLNKNRGSKVKIFAFRLKDKIKGALARYLSPPCLGIVAAMVLGDKDGVPPLVYSAMVKTGTVHILVVSGFNVGIVASVILLVLKLMRLPRRARIILAVPSLVLYCLVSGASTPVVRAVIMAEVFLLSYLVCRSPDIYASLALAGLLILGFQPSQLSDIGFQLSFASVAGLIYLYPKIRSFSRVEAMPTRPLRFIVDTCLVSLSAWLATMGLIAYYFRIFSPVTVLANLFIVPLAGLITLCGFSLLLASLVFPPCALFFARSSEFIIAWLLNINAFLAGIPYSCLVLP